MPRDTLFFDGGSSFCNVWVEFWRSLTGDRVDYVAKPGEPLEFVTEAGQYQSAEAIFVLLSLVSGYEWLLRFYRRIPGLGPLIELTYRIVARHRNAAYRLTRLLWGSRVERPTYRVASALFSRTLAFIYLIAFASFGMQVRGLIGSDGILPVTTYFQLATSTFGSAALWKVP